MEMKVDIVKFVENEMVELNVAQIGLNWGWIEVEYGDESDYESGKGGDASGDEYAKKTDFIGIPLHPLHPPNNPPNNQSKPSVPTPSHSLL